MGESQIGVDHADQLEEGKVVALGNELGADDDIDLALGDRGQLQPQAVDAAGKIARQNDAACLREARRDLLRQPLDARTDGHQAFRVTA